MMNYDNTFKLGAITSILVVLTIILFTLQGCVYATYNAEDGKEALRVLSLFKEVDGFSADRDENQFHIMIDKTRSADPFEGLADLLEQVDTLRSMGISYDPPDAVVPFPVD